MSSHHTGRTTNPSGENVFINIYNGRRSPPASSPSSEDRATSDKRPMPPEESLFNDIGAHLRNQAANRDQPTGPPYPTEIHGVWPGYDGVHRAYAGRHHESASYRNYIPWGSRVPESDRERLYHTEADPRHPQPRDHSGYEQRRDSGPQDVNSTRRSRPQTEGRVDGQPSKASPQYDDFGQHVQGSQTWCSSDGSRRNSNLPKDRNSVEHHADAPLRRGAFERNEHDERRPYTNVDPGRNPPSNLQDYRPRSHNDSAATERDRTGSIKPYAVPYVYRPTSPRQNRFAGNRRDSHQQAAGYDRRQQPPPHESYDDRHSHNAGVPQQDQPRRGSAFEHNGASRFHRHHDPYKHGAEAASRYDDGSQGRYSGPASTGSSSGADPSSRASRLPQHFQQYTDAAEVPGRYNYAMQDHNDVRASSQARQPYVHDTVDLPQQDVGSEASAAREDARSRCRARRNSSVHFDPNLPPDREEDRQPEPAWRQSHNAQTHHHSRRAEDNDITGVYHSPLRQEFGLLDATQLQPDPINEPTQGQERSRRHRPRAGSISTQVDSVFSQGTPRYLPGATTPSVIVVERDGRKRKFQCRPSRK